MASTDSSRLIGRFFERAFQNVFFVHLFQKNTVDFCKTSIYSTLDGKVRFLVLIWALNPSFFPNCILPPNSQKTARLENPQKSHQTITSGKPSVSAYRQLSASRQLSRLRYLCLFLDILWIFEITEKSCNLSEAKNSSPGDASIHVKVLAILQRWVRFRKRYVLRCQKTHDSGWTHPRWFWI